MQSFQKRAVELRLSKIHFYFLQDFIGLPKLAIIALKGFDPIPFGSRHTITPNAVRFCASNPRPKRISPTTDLGRNRFDRSRLAVKFVLMLEYHQNSTVAHLW